MKELLERFSTLERTLAEENGGFSLFALFLRDEGGSGIGTSGYSGYSAKWDLVVAAPWIEADRKGALTKITKMIQETFSAEELSQLSRVVLVDLTNPEVTAVNQAINVEHGRIEVRDVNFFGLQIRHGYIITSQRINVGEEVLA